MAYTAMNNLPPIPQEEIGENLRWRQWFFNLGLYINRIQFGDFILDPSHGGTGLSSPAGFLYGNGASPMKTYSVIPISLGGTGATNSAGARTNLGLGSMAVQNADSVSITGGTAKLSSLELSSTSPGTPAPYRMVADTSQGTVSLGMGYDAVNLSVGMEEYYPPVLNNTGSNIPNGTLVGFSGVGTGDTPTITPWIADGSFPAYTVMGIATMDIPNGEKGIVAKFGYIHNVDTTGTPVSETWNVGDVLFASPTNVGKLTKVKPTAPNLFVPVAAVISKNATTGTLLARVQPQPQLYYGVFSDSTTQSLTLADTIYPITLDTTDISNGFSRGTPTSRIVAANAGLYNFQLSIQIRSTNSSQRSVFIWPRINGVDVTNSTTEVAIKSNTDVIVASWNFVLSLQAGQYFELVCAADGTGVSLASSAAQTTPYVRPAIPSIILTVTQANQ